MENNRKEAGNNNSKNFNLKGEWITQSSALKSRYPKLINEDMKFDSDKERYLFI